MIHFFKIFFKEIYLILRAKKIGYYTHIDFLPVYNWYQIVKGDFGYLYKNYNTIYPEFFKEIPMQLFFQLEKVDMSYFEDMQKLAYLKALYTLHKRHDFLNQYTFLKSTLEKKYEKEKKHESLNEVVNFIEENNKAIGSIDVHKMSTSRFFSLYYRTIDKIKAQNNANSKT